MTWWKRILVHSIENHGLAPERENRVASTIEFSAQFGGRDAEAAVLPHFNVLKSVARGKSLEEFPYKSIAFILRVDGSVNSYGYSGLGNIDIKRPKYVSLDIGVLKEDYTQGTTKLVSVIGDAIAGGADFLRHSGDARLSKIDYTALSEELAALQKSYQEAIKDQL